MDQVGCTHLLQHVVWQLQAGEGSEGAQLLGEDLKDAALKVQALQAARQGVAGTQARATAVAFVDLQAEVGQLRQRCCCLHELSQGSISKRQL